MPEDVQDRKDAGAGTAAAEELSAPCASKHQALGAEDVAAVPASSPAQDARAGQTVPKTARKKGISFKGMCIFCGERFELAEEEMSARSFGFCNAECKMKFDMELAEDID